MTCQELENLLYPYLDGEFAPEERLEVERHLTGCEACTRRVREEERTQRALRLAARQAVQEVRAPESLRLVLQAGLRREQRREVQQRWVRASAAALVVMAAGGVWVWLQPEQRHRFLEDAARRHARPLPHEIAGVNPEHVEQWFDGKLEHRVPVPRLPNAVVAGARISNVTDRPAAYISYERAPANAGEVPRRIGLFVFDDTRQDVEAPPLDAVQVSSSHGYNVAMWRDGEIVYELVTDLEESDIRRMLSKQENWRQAAPVMRTPELPVRPVSLQQ